MQIIAPTDENSDSPSHTTPAGILLETKPNNRPSSIVRDVEMAEGRKKNMSKCKSSHRRIDTLHEQEVIDRLWVVLGWDCRRTDPRCFYDLIHRDLEGQTRDIVEVKFRNVLWGQYPTIHLSEKKVQNCLEAANLLGCGFHFAVLCQSGLYMAGLTELNTRDLPRKQGGRTDRGLAKDIETLIDIPNYYFTKI